MSYTLESTATPFWAQNDGFTGGRDPLGIQNSSVSIYRSLLPGLNNVTERLRYYGFYCWLLTSIEQRNFEFTSHKDQYNFIRKAEYTIALFTALRGGAPDIPGIDFANDQIQSHSSSYNIEKSAVKRDPPNNDPVYWSFSSGAFGQYYVGSLLTLGLIETKDHYFYATPEGKELGVAFEQSLNPDAIEIFLSIVQKGILQSDDVDKLETFSMTEIPTDSNEWKFYMELFFSADLFRRKAVAPTFYRKQSWLLLLDYLMDHSIPAPSRRFPEYLYKQAGHVDQPGYNGASIGWYYYQVNELMHYALESIFYVVLSNIEAGDFTVSELSNQLALECLASFLERYQIKEEASCNALIDQLKDREKLSLSYPAVIAKSIKQKKRHEILPDSIELLLLVYLEIERHIPQLQAFTTSTNTCDKNGTALQLINLDLRPRLHMPILELIKHLIRKVINDHLHIAYAKMSARSDKQVHKLLLEDNYLVHINTVEPRFTSPRLQTVINFMRDLRLIEMIEKDTYKLTSKGIAALENYNS